MTSHAPDPTAKAPGQQSQSQPLSTATAKFSVKAICGAVRRCTLSHAWLLPLLSGMATLAILFILAWFFLISPYSGPSEFVYNQF